jgi:RNA polymerase sigma-70 factor (ECF subfamily)
MAHERRIRGYILALVANTADADDLMQETSAILWRKFDTYQPGTSFLNWALAIARFEVLKHREGRGGASRTSGLDAAAFDALADTAAVAVERADERCEALAKCLTKLPDADRRLIQSRYDHEQPVPRIAQELGRTISAVYKALTRVHRQLLDCIDTTLRSERP